MTHILMCMLSCFNHVQPFACAWTADCCPPSRGFSKQELCSGLAFPPPRDRSHQALNPHLPQFLYRRWILYHWPMGGVILSFSNSIITLTEVVTYSLSIFIPENFRIQLIQQNTGTRAFIVTSLLYIPIMTILHHTQMENSFHLKLNLIRGPTWNTENNTEILG